MTVMTPDEAIAPRTGSSKCRRIVRWMFVNRLTGGVTIAQWPNVALSVFIRILGLGVLLTTVSSFALLAR
jgi:hypothetical protein